MAEDAFKFPRSSRHSKNTSETPELTGKPFNKHSLNREMGWRHISPFDNGNIFVGLDGIQVELLKGIDEEGFFRVVNAVVMATTGQHAEDAAVDMTNVEELLSGGALQQGLEAETIAFAVSGVSRACTHQLVRTRKAAFAQQSQRATWYGTHPDVRMPETIWNDERARMAYLQSVSNSWQAYREACDQDLPYQDARYILPEGVTNSIVCIYTVREFINTYAYRSCFMFQHEIGHVFRLMGQELVSRHPWLEKYVQTSCVKAGRSTFTGWESVNACPVPTCNDKTRAFVPSPENRIGWQEEDKEQQKQEGPEVGLHQLDEVIAEIARLQETARRLLHQVRGDRKEEGGL